ncbi:MAG: hypothetical protein DDG60_10200 [Anaerolineae bacterium]|nr:MAG: hypothetical protein DDG60_10200 [Anaerolineae bacterium]
MEIPFLIPVSLLSTCLGFMFLMGAGFLLFQNSTVRGGIQTQGTVIGLASDPNEPDMFTPVIRFQTQTGQECTFQGTVYSGKPEHKIGQRVTVVYHANQPEKARIKGENRVLLLIVGGFGIVLTCVGLVLGMGGLISAL